MKVLSNLRDVQDPWLHRPFIEERPPKLRRSNRIRTPATTDHDSAIPTYRSRRLTWSFWASERPFELPASEEEYQMLKQNMWASVRKLIARKYGRPEMEETATPAQEPTAVVNISSDDSDNPQTPTQTPKREAPELNRPHKRVCTQREETLSSGNIEADGCANKKRRLNNVAKGAVLAQCETPREQAELNRDESSSERKAKRKHAETQDEGRKKQKLDGLEAEHRTSEPALNLESSEERPEGSDENRRTHDGAYKGLFGVRRWLGI